MRAPRAPARRPHSRDVSCDHRCPRTALRYVSLSAPWGAITDRVLLLRQHLPPLRRAAAQGRCCTSVHAGFSFSSAAPDPETVRETARSLSTLPLVLRAAQMGYLTVARVLYNQSTIIFAPQTTLRRSFSISSVLLVVRWGRRLTATPAQICEGVGLAAAYKCRGATVISIQLPPRCRHSPITPHTAAEIPHFPHGEVPPAPRRRRKAAKRRLPSRQASGGADTSQRRPRQSVPDRCK